MGASLSGAYHCACMQVDTIAALTNVLTMLMSRDPPVRLDPYGALIPNPNADMSPANGAEEQADPFATTPPRSPRLPSGTLSAATPTASLPPVSDGWIFNALGAFCLLLVDAPDPAVAIEAARTLLHLRWLQVTLHYPRLQVAPVPSLWPRTAVSALLRVADPLDAVIAREACTQITCRYFSVLSPEEVPAVAKRVIHWIVQRASGSSRVANLLLLWRAVVDVDLSIWRRAQTEGLVPKELACPPVAVRPHGSALIDLLETPMVKALRAGDATVRCSAASHLR
jgi:hypothetical protein